MSKKDEILREGIQKNGLGKQIVVGSFMWDFITGCMQSHTDQAEIEQWNVTINQTKPLGSTKLVAESNQCTNDSGHKFLLMGYGAWICDHCDQFEKR